MRVVFLHPLALSVLAVLAALAALAALAPAGVAEAAFVESAAAFGIAGGDSMSYSAAFVDQDGDGDPDLYVNHHWKGPADLYRNEGGTWLTETSGHYGTGNSDRHDQLWADLDGDGDPDQYILHGGGQNNELFRNLGGSQFEERAVDAGLTDVFGRGRELSIADFDGDGDVDIFVVCDTEPAFPRPGSLFWNDGSGAFTAHDSDALLFRPRIHCAAADYDLDGIVDIVTTAPSDQPGELWRGQGDSTWVESAAVAFPGISDPLREGESLTWADYDDDGDLDLLVGGGNRGIWEWAGLEGDSLRWYAEAEAGEAKTLTFTTDGDSLTLFAAASRYQTLVAWTGAAGDSVTSYPAPLSLAAILGEPPALAGATEGLFVWSAPGPGVDTVHVVLAAPGLESIAAGGTIRANASGVLAWSTTGYASPPPYSTHDWSNRLFRNDGAGAFEEVTNAAFAVNPSTSNCKAAAWGDYDNDGDLDVYVTDGGTIATGNRPNFLYRNEGDGTFTDVAAAEGVAGSAVGMTDGAAWADVDGDGFLDLFVDHGAEHPPFGVGPRELFLNTPNGNHWVELALRGLGSNGSAIGARVRFVSAGGVQWRTRLGESDNCFSNAHVLHVGLGAAALVDTMQIHWPSGATDTHTDVPGDARWVAVEGQPLRPTGAPHLTIGIPSVTDTLRSFEFSTRSVPLGNLGGAACELTASVVDSTGAVVSWATVEPTVTAVWPGGSDPLAVSLQAPGLPAGRHLALLVLASNSVAGPDTVLVDLEVLAPAVGVEEAPIDLAPLPDAVRLGRPRPHPARSAVTLAYALPARAAIALAVYDVTGRRVRTLARAEAPAGAGSITWDLRNDAGRRVGAGIYLVRLETPSTVRARRVVVLD